MDGVVDLRAGSPAAPVGAANQGSLSRRDCVRRLFELPVDRGSDCGVRIEASAAGRCAACSGRYAAGEWIGHSREADGWVASCCM